MAKITVNLETFYGYSCGFQGHGSNETVEIDISENELKALKKFGKDKISAKDVIAAIEGGDTSLESLHEQLEEKFYYMVEEYWLYEAYNECLHECLAEHIEQDINDGLYSPISSVGDGFDCHCWDGCDDEEDNEEDNEEYDLDAYYEWIKEHDHEFAAERVGLDLNACRDDEVNYKINLSL